MDFIFHSRLDRTVFGMMKEQLLIDDTIGLIITTKLRSP